ncbi:hypothetical protein [Tsukamurella spumae]|uniref:Tetratricopeptide repeat protein n=1 Tax=Tsukamurella spumae TaxID=44753 RepID=A0A846WYD7_9ACTN|nr:hypothetical protein [Tsukamurella spumae]NKY17265.1 hypothetical protein [Tsukamurella spumae]
MENLMTELGAAMTGEQAERKQKLESVWVRIEPSDHASRCIAAHYIADVQGDVEAEVEWDEVALAESAHVSDADLQAVHASLSVAGFMPSLHLNLADGYRRQGRFTEASDRLQTSREFDFALDTALDPSYASGIREAQVRLAARIAAGDRAGEPGPAAGA